MPGPPRKTALRSFRISREADEILQKEAAARGLSVNALVSQIFQKFVEWDRFAERYGFVSIQRDGFQAMHEALGDEGLIKMAKEIGSRNPREASLFWFKRVDLESFLSWLSLQCRYAKIAEYEMERNGKQCSITLHHALGERYSLFLGTWCDQALRTIAHVIPKFETTKNSIVLSFEV
ncbi:MAG: hypothetical protein JRN28_03215 [Nitrososphaerota archaeon]|nr:hypothetical protein [Nitrososphaerota archaeon]